jgi:hypothetical protein
LVLVVVDDELRNGHYATALLSILRSKGHELDICKLLILVRDAVLETTAGIQQPWHDSSLSSFADVFLMPA